MALEIESDEADDKSTADRRKPVASFCNRQRGWTTSVDGRGRRRGARGANRVYAGVGKFARGTNVEGGPWGPRIWTSRETETKWEVREEFAPDRREKGAV